MDTIILSRAKKKLFVKNFNNQSGGKVHREKNLQNFADVGIILGEHLLLPEMGRKFY